QAGGELDLAAAEVDDVVGGAAAAVERGDAGAAAVGVRHGVAGPQPGRVADEDAGIAGADRLRLGRGQAGRVVQHHGLDGDAVTGDVGPGDRGVVVGRADVEGDGRPDTGWGVGRVGGAAVGQG